MTFLISFCARKCQNSGKFGQASSVATLRVIFLLTVVTILVMLLTHFLIISVRFNYVVNADRPTKDRACSIHTLVDNINDFDESSVSQLCLDINVELIDKIIKK